MCPANLTEYSDSQQRSAQRALDTLDRLDNRLDAHFSTKRKHARRPFRGTATIRLPAGPAGSPPDLQVWTRSISESGLSFICPVQIRDPWVLVGLTPPVGDVIWFFANVVRRKQVPEEGFCEYGVAFRGRVKD